MFCCWTWSDFCRFFDGLLERLDRARELDDLGSHQSMVAVGSVKLSEKGVRGPFSEAVGNVLAVTGVVWKGSVKVTDDVRKVEGVWLRWRKVLIEEYRSGDVGGFLSDGGKSGCERGWGNIFFVGICVRGGDVFCRL